MRPHLALLAFLLFAGVYGYLPTPAAADGGEYSITITPTPEEPSLADTLTVTAVVSPTTNITDVKLGYALCTEGTCGLFTYVDMQEISVGVYRAEIGPFPEDRGYVEVKLKVSLTLTDNSTYSSKVLIVPFQVENTTHEKKNDGGLPLSPYIPLLAFTLAGAVALLRRRWR